MFNLIRATRPTRFCGPPVLYKINDPPITNPPKIYNWYPITTVMVKNTEWDTYRITSVRAAEHNIVTSPSVYIIRIYIGNHYETAIYSNYIRYKQTLDMLRLVLDDGIIRED